MELKEKACLVQEICAHHVAIELEKAAGSSEDRMLKESLMILSDRVIEEGKTIRTRVEYDLDLSDDFSFMDSFLNFETRTDLTEARAALESGVNLRGVAAHSEHFLQPGRLACLVHGKLGEGGCVARVGRHLRQKELHLVLG